MVDKEEDADEQKRFPLLERSGGAGGGEGERDPAGRGTVCSNNVLCNLDREHFGNISQLGPRHLHDNCG